MRKNPVVRAMPRWTSEPESTEWFDTFNLDGEELIGFVPESQQSKEEDKKKKQEKKACKGVKKEKMPEPTEKGFVVVDGKQRVIALGTPASYQVLVETEFEAPAKQDSEQAHKRQQKADENRTQHLKMVAEMRTSFFASTGELLIAELVVATVAQCQQVGKHQQANKHQQADKQEQAD